MAQKKIPQPIRRHVKKYLKSLNVPVEQAFIFGSHTKGNPHKYSDIDVAIVSPRFHNSLATTKYLLRKAHELSSPLYYIEPHGFHTDDFIDENPLAWEIKKTGMKLHLVDK